MKVHLSFLTGGDLVKSLKDSSHLLKPESRARKSLVYFGVIAFSSKAFFEYSEIKRYLCPQVIGLTLRGGNVVQFDFLHVVNDVERSRFQPCTSALFSDPGSAAVRLVWGAPALLLLPESRLHPFVCHVRVSSRCTHSLPSRLALSLLPAHGSHQRLLWVCANDPGCWQSAAWTAGAGRWVTHLNKWM